MTELQKRAKEYLTLKGVKSIGDKFIALEVMDLLCEFAYREQLNIGGVSQQRELLLVFANFKDQWEHDNNNMDGNEIIVNKFLETNR